MNRHEVISNSARRSYNTKTLNPSFTGVVFNYLTPVLYENLIQRKNFTLKICKETMHTNSFVFYFTKNFYLVDEFNTLINTFESAGLIEQVMSKYVDMNLMKLSHKQPPSVITYDNIEGFFELFYYGCALALVSFMCEIIFGYVKQKQEIRRKKSLSREEHATRAW